VSSFRQLFFEGWHLLSCKPLVCSTAKFTSIIVAQGISHSFFASSLCVFSSPRTCALDESAITGIFKAHPFLTRRFQNRYKPRANVTAQSTYVVGSSPRSMLVYFQKTEAWLFYSFPNANLPSRNATPQCASVLFILLSWYSHLGKTFFTATVCKGICSCLLPMRDTMDDL